MPMYEYRCRSCGEIFEALRAVGAANEPPRCSAGHTDTVRSLSLVARPSRGAETTVDGGGACCASGCACGRN